MRGWIASLSSMALLAAMVPAPARAVSATPITFAVMVDNLTAAHGSVSGLQVGSAAYVSVPGLLSTMQAAGLLTGFASDGMHLRFRAPAGVPLESGPVYGKGTDSIQVGPTVIARFTPVHAGTQTYLPLDVWQAVLARFRVLTGVQDGMLNVWDGISASVWEMYQRRYGGLGIAVAYATTREPGGDLWIQYARRGEGAFAPVRVGVITPSGVAYDGATQGTRSDHIQFISLEDGQYAASFVGAGMHALYAQWLRRDAAGWAVQRSFFGDFGVTVWVQDGHAQVATSNSTESSLVAPDGQSDRAIETVLYREGASAFRNIASFRSGEFQAEPTWVTNPQFDTVSLLYSLVYHARNVSQFVRDWKGQNVSQSVLSALAKNPGRLAFLAHESPDVVVSLRTVANAGDRVAYAWHVAGHTITVTLQRHGNWIIEGLQVRHGA